MEECWEPMGDAWLWAGRAEQGTHLQPGRYKRLRRAAARPLMWSCSNPKGANATGEGWEIQSPAGEKTRWGSKQEPRTCFSPSTLLFEQVFIAFDLLFTSLMSAARHSYAGNGVVGLALSCRDSQVWFYGVGGSFLEVVGKHKVLGGFEGSKKHLSW